MSNRLQKLLDSMPRHFAHDEDSNNYKLLKIIAENSIENKTIYNTISKYWDIDKAEGIALDRLGKDEGIKRGSWDDEEYRKMIKIECILNPSEGDIDTMNLILDAYMGDSFIGIEDGWSLLEPSSIIVNANTKVKSFPNWLIERIKPVGVSYTLSVIDEKAITLETKCKEYPHPYFMCDTFACGTRPDVDNLGFKVNTSLEANTNEKDTKQKYDMAGTFEVGGDKI